MGAIIWLVDTCVTIYIWILIAQVVLSWLVAFNIVNTRQPFVRQLGNALWRLTEPVLGPVRRIMPNLGGLDISPIIVILLLEFLRRFNIGSILVPMMMDGM